MHPVQARVQAKDRNIKLETKAKNKSQSRKVF